MSRPTKLIWSPHLDVVTRRTVGLPANTMTTKLRTAPRKRVTEAAGHPHEPDEPSRPDVRDGRITAMSSWACRQPWEQADSSDRRTNARRRRSPRQLTEL